MKLFFYRTLAFLSLAGPLLAQDITTGLLVHLPLDEINPQDDPRELVSGGKGTSDLYWPHTRLNPGFKFDGSQMVAFNDSGKLNGLNRLTVSTWVKPIAFGNTQSIAAKSFGGSRPIAWQLLLQNGVPSLRCNAVGAVGTPGDSTFSAGGSLTPGVWQHLAVTSNGMQVKFYVNGVETGSTSQSITFGSSWGYLYLGTGEGGGNYGLNGALYDMRIYNRALSAADLAPLAATKPQLRIATTFTGLWSGSATLNEVKEATTGSWSPAPAFSQQVLLHVDSNGGMRLLSEATLMRTRAAPPVQVVVTQPSLLGNFDGITLRGGRLIGQRFSSATCNAPQAGLAIEEGGLGYQAVWSMNGNDPINPFRHKYHPDLGSGRALTRTVGFSFAAGESPSDNTLTGTFSESIAGLHKTTLEARGPIIFTRVSTAGKLNQP